LSDTLMGIVSSSHPHTRSRSDWIVDIGPQTFTSDPHCAPCYEYAVVSDSRQLSLFVLARDPAVFASTYDAQVKAYLNGNGFTKAWNKPIVSSQGTRLLLSSFNCFLFRRLASIYEFFNARDARPFTRQATEQGSQCNYIPEPAL
jgi:hypothetical protein